VDLGENRMDADNWKWTRIPRQAHDTYLNHVAAQCDKADIRSSSSWRNQYYDADLELIISRIVEIRQQRSIILHPVQQTDMLNGEIASMTQSSFGLHSNFHSLIPPESVVKPLLAYGASSCYEYHDSDNPGMHLNTLQNTRRVNPTACSVTESDLLSDGSPSSTQSLTEPSSQTSVDITICPYCSNRSFEGESQNRRRNLRRHMLSEHGVDPRLPCHVAGCPATFKPGRFDNLKRHMKQQHGRDSPPASPTGRKRKAIDL